MKLSDIKLFRTSDDSIEELKGSAIAVEKSLQKLIEKHLETFLGIRFLASEYQTGKVHGGRIDTLGIDENGFPVIIEYKRATNENVINQGLFYLDWLMDHKAEYQLLVMNRIGKEQADKIEWSSPRLLCIAGGFTNYDEHAVKQIPRSIELIRYRRFGDELLLFELLNTALIIVPHNNSPNGIDEEPSHEGHLATLNQASPDLRALFESLRDFLMALGSDVQMKSLRQYIAFKRIRNFAGVAIRPQGKAIHIWIGIPVAEIPSDSAFAKSEKNGSTRITIKDQTDLLRAQPLMLASYEAGMSGSAW